MAVPQADKPRGPPYVLAQPRVALPELRPFTSTRTIRIRPSHRGKHTIDTSTRSGTPPSLWVPDTHSPPFQTLREYSLTLPFFFFSDMSYYMYAHHVRVPSFKPRAAFHYTWHTRIPPMLVSLSTAATGISCGCSAHETRHSSSSRSSRWTRRK
jgi:hypothetical protein